MTTLMKGDRHPAVGLLQQKLNFLGASPPLAVDNDFGDHTRLAVRRFQENQPALDSVYGGIAGPMTLDRLGIGFAVRQLTLKLPLTHRRTENWAAGLGADRIGYSEYGYRNSDPGQVLDVRTYRGSGFRLKGYERLAGGRINVVRGVFMFHGADDPDRAEVSNNECALFVQAFGLPKCRFWLRGPRVKDVAHVLPGTVVATLRDDCYYSDHSGRSHVAIFLSKTDRKMTTLDQWNGSDIHEVTRSFQPENTGEMNPSAKRPYRWVSDADEYYILYSLAACGRKDYDSR